MPDDDFELSEHQLKWASKRRHGKTPSFLLELVRTQRGLCAFSGVPLLFTPIEGTPIKNGLGAHPLYAALDHKDPGNSNGEFQLVCYALNDLKGHLSVELFEGLQKSEAWSKLMKEWQSYVESGRSREDLYRLLRPNATKRADLEQRGLSPASLHQDPPAETE